MSKINVFNLPRPERPELEKSYSEAGETVTLCLRWPNASDRARASEMSRDLMRDFVHGDPSTGRETAPFPDPDVIPSETLFQACALVASMEQDSPTADLYSALELAVISGRLPRVWMQIQSDVSRLLREGEQRQGESHTGHTASSAETPSTSTTSIPI
jgi:hypothetical protein